MARLWLIAVLLLSSASAGSCGKKLPVKQNEVSKPTEDLIKKPDLKEMKEIVNNLWNRYRPSYISNNQRWFPMFSLAVSIPYDNNKKKYDVSKVTDDPKKVEDTIIGCDVYKKRRMVAATVLKWDDVLYQCPNAQVPWKDILTKCKICKGTSWTEVNTCLQGFRRADHAEYRVLQNIHNLDERKKKKDFLLFYVYASPCDQKCANTTSPFNILDSINVIKKWTNYAVVFSKVFKPKVGEPVPVEKLKGALERLGKHDGPLGPIGLENIYRCDGWKCMSCSSGNDVTPFCYSDDRQPAPSNNAVSTSVNNINDGRNAAVKKGKNG